MRVSPPSDTAIVPGRIVVVPSFREIGVGCASQRVTPVGTVAGASGVRAGASVSTARHAGRNTASAPSSSDASAASSRAPCADQRPSSFRGEIVPASSAVTRSNVASGAPFQTSSGAPRWPSESRITAFITRDGTDAATSRMSISRSSASLA